MNIRFPSIYSLVRSPRRLALAATFAGVAALLLGWRSQAQENPPPGPPRDLQVSDVTAAAARVSWLAAEGPAGIRLSYDLELRQRIGGVAQPWRRGGETAETSFALLELAPATVYEVRVRAWAKTVAGPWAIKENAFKTLDGPPINRPPTVPGAIQVSDVTAHAARISWSAATDPDGDRLGYLISVRKRTEGVAQEWSPAQDTAALAVVLDGLSANTVYDARVRASDGKALSDWVGKEVAFRTLTEATQAPSAPGEIVVSEITAHSARISWLPATGPVGIQIAYGVELRRRLEGVPQAWQHAGETAATSLLVGELAPDAVYDVRVQAWAKTVPGPWAAVENAFRTLEGPPANRPPSIPSAIQVANVTAHSARISWSAATDPEGHPISYLVSLRKRLEGVAQEWSAPKVTVGTTTIWDGLAPETLYEARVRASDGETFSNWLIEENAFRTLTENNAPTRPGDIGVTEITATTARVSWEPARGPAGVELAYDVELRQRWEGVAQTWKHVRETLGTTVVVEGLVSGTVYDVRVRAWAQGIAGAWGIKENAFKTLGGQESNHPPTLPGVIEIALVGPHSARLAWGAASDADGDRLRYQVSLRRRLEGVAQEWQTARETAATALTWDGLAPKAVYDARVRATDGKTFSAWLLKENAFTTLASSGLTGFVEHANRAPADSTPKTVTITWPVSTVGVIEASADLSSSSWTRLNADVETDGTVNRAIIPADGAVRFFRVR